MNLVAFSIVILSSVVATGCDTSPTVPSNGHDDTRSVGNAVPANPEAAALTEVVRLTANALEDEGLRRRVISDMRGARYWEHKLNFNAYIIGESGGILLAKIAQTTGSSPEEFLSLLDVLPPLEFYMPVEEHRTSWTGEADIVVAGQIEDADTPVGYTVNGAPFSLSVDAPPEQPVLSIVPVETDFSRPLAPGSVRNTQDAGGNAVGVYVRVGVSSSEECDGAIAVDECTGTGGGSELNWSNLPAGIWIEEMYLADLGESWTKGEPEIEIHTAFQDPLESSAEIIGCVAESNSGDFQYVMNDNSSDDVALIGTQEQINALPSGQGLMFIVYEDDDTTCVIKDETDALQNTIGTVKALKNGFDGLTSEDGTVGKIVQIAESVIDVITLGSGVIQTNDDLIGEIIENSCIKDGRTGNWEVRRDTGLQGCATVRAN